MFQSETASNRQSGPSESATRRPPKHALQSCNVSLKASAFSRTRGDEAGAATRWALFSTELRADARHSQLELDDQRADLRTEAANRTNSPSDHAVGSGTAAESCKPAAESKLLRQTT